MIQFVNVSKLYGGKESDLTAVENINFEVEDGEFVFLIGPSGSGKTTIIKLLIHEVTPSSGKIYFDEDDITRYSRKQVYQLRRKVGVIFQDYKLIEDKTTAENIEFVMEAAGKSQKEIEETVPYLLDIVGLADRRNSFPRELSGGEKQRIAIARALANNPKVLIADEPTGNLDPKAAWEVVQILKKVNEWGTTVIMSTHGSDIVDKISKRVLQMDNGVLIRDEKLGKYQSATDAKKENFEKAFVEDNKEVESEVVDETPKEETVDTTIEPEIEISSENTEEITEVDEVIPEEVNDSSPTEKLKVEDSEPKKEVEINEEKVEDETPIAKKPKENKKLKISLVHKKGNEKVVEKKEIKSNNFAELELSVLELPVKLEKVLTGNNIKNIEQLINAGIDGIGNIKDLDSTDIDIIKKALDKFISTQS